MLPSDILREEEDELEGEMEGGKGEEKVCREGGKTAVEGAVYGVGEGDRDLVLLLYSSILLPHFV